MTWRLIRVAIIALALGLPSAMLGHPDVSAPLRLVAPQVAYADHNGPHLPGDPMNYPTQARMVNRAYLTYCFDALSASYPNLRAQTATVAAYAQSKGMVPAYEQAWGTDCDIKYNAPSHVAFTNTFCGAGAYGCNFYWHDGIDIYIDLQGANAAYYNESTIGHEGLNTGHSMFLHEQYHDCWTVSASCPTVDVHSNGRTWTLMDYGVRQPGDPLGRNMWAITDWDRDRIYNAFVPDAPASVTLTVSGGWASVSWSANRADGGYAHLNGIAANSSATAMGFGYAAYDGAPIRNVGDICGPAFNYCASPYGAGSRSFDAFWHGCIYVRAWNNAFGNVPQVSAPDYWTKAGCWA